MPNFAASDGTSLFEKVWPASGQAHAIVVLVHGYGEHIERYDETAGALAKAGFHVRGFDLRGHGQSGGTRGFCLRFDEYLDDLALVIARAKKDWAGPPLFLVGHSFGGLISCKYVLKDASQLAGLIVSSPYFKLAMEVPAIKVIAGRLMSKIIPKLSLPSGLKGSDVSRDPDIAAKYDRDPLNNKNATARWFTEASAAQEEVLARASEIKLPCLFLHGGADKIAAPQQTELIFGKLAAADKTLKVYPGQFHEIFNELPEDRRKTLKDVTEWLAAHAASAGKLHAQGA